MNKVKIFSGKCTTSVQKYIDMFVSDNTISILDIKMHTNDSRYESIVIALIYEVK